MRVSLAPLLKPSLKSNFTTMPSIHRQSAMPTVVTKPAGPRKERVVGFVKGEVTGISRPANIAESWALYDFEMHARACAECRNPYDVHRSGRQLCDEGHRLAQQVAHFLYMKRDGEAYSTEEEDRQVVRVEIQPTYEEARGLLRAIERGIRHRRQFVSMDRSYHIAPRLPLRTKNQKPVQPVQVEQAPALPPRPKGNHEQYEWPASPRQAVINVAKRGSLYESDMEEQRRNFAKYNIEVREPSHRDMREHRHSGYYR
ncbi:Macro domain containing protein 1 [Lasiodiplodia theobromae]|nr:Macro domain containing protein 1 [Lasiodiplodia theobromae]KAF4541951.1 Macro domain containing protein 1 [Lasiodiplodia theobromae]